MNSKTKWIFPALLQLALLSSLLSGCSSMGSALEASPSLANAAGVADIPMPYLEDHYVKEDDKFMRVNGYNIHYRDMGQGPPIVLCHGLFSALQTWDTWTAELSKTHRVIALDMPGFGMTGAPENMDDYSLQNAVNTFAKFVDQLQLEHFSLAGNSVGGYVAAEYAANYPDRVDRLLLLDPFGYPQDLPWLMNLTSLAPMRFIGRYFLPPVVITMNLRTAYGDPRRIKDEDAYRYVRMSQRPGAREIYMKTLGMMQDQVDEQRPLPFYQIKAPTLIMWGGEDHWIPKDVAQKWLNDIPDARLIVYPGVGHVPMEETPKTTLRDAEPFFSGGFAALDKTKQAGGDAPQSANGSESDAALQSQGDQNSQDNGGSGTQSPADNQDNTAPQPSP